MTGSEIVTKFENMVDDVIDTDYAYQLLNDAKAEIEDMRDWEMLKKETTYPVTAGYTYTSSLGSLPTRFSTALRMTENTGFVQYSKFDFEDIYAKANAGNGYFINLPASTIFLTGSNHSSKTMYFYYTEYTADIDATSSWSFPDRFHSLIALKMAEIYYMGDAGERGRSWDDKWSIQFERGLNRMMVWDDRLKSRGRRPRNRGNGLNPKAVY